MARSRNIKPSFFTNDELAENNSPLGRLFFAGLWCIADFKGDIEWRPGRLKVQLLPYDECDVKEIAINLDKSGFVTFYSCNDKMFLHINNFGKHQNPHPNEKKKGSQIPEYSEEGRQLVDLKELTINRDKSRQVSEDSITDRADSLIPYPLTPNPDSLSVEFALDVAFDELWKLFTGEFGSKGSRKNAETAFQKLKPDIALFNRMIENLKLQNMNKSDLKALGQFAEPYQHVERWIKNRRWEDEISPISRQFGNGDKFSKSDRTKQAVKDYLNESQDSPGVDSVTVVGARP